MLKKISIGLLVLIGGVMAFAATRPDTYEVVRTVSMNAPADVIFAQVNDFKNWAQWSPWENLDPGMKKTFTGPATGVGAIYQWAGNDKVGKGKMTLTEAQSPTQIGIKLEFIEPFASTAATTFAFVTDSASTATSWTMKGSNNFVGKLFGLFMDVEGMIGKDFDKGLAALKGVSEAAERVRIEKAAAAEMAKVADAINAGTKAAVPVSPTP